MNTHSSYEHAFMAYDMALEHARDVHMYPEEFMDNREVEARELGFRLVWDADGVWLFHPEGEGGRFNKTELLNSMDDLETFFWKFF